MAVDDRMLLSYPQRTVPAKIIFQMLPVSFGFLTKLFDELKTIQEAYTERDVVSLVHRTSFVDGSDISAALFPSDFFPDAVAAVRPNKNGAGPKIISKTLTSFFEKLKVTLSAYGSGSHVIVVPSTASISTFCEKGRRTFLEE
jgi:hypothetical protein